MSRSKKLSFRRKPKKSLYKTKRKVGGAVSLIRKGSVKKRRNSPLIRVKDAILIRTDRLSKKQVLLKMSKHIDKLI